MKLITDIMREIRRGLGVQLASEAMCDLTLAVKDTGKSGTLTLTFTLTPDKTEEGRIIATMKHKLNMPTPDVGDSVFFADEEGNLTRTDPRQTEMELTDVATGSGRKLGAVPPTAS